MDLTQLANLGEFVGGVAVIGSLLYVGIQVRAQANESRLASVHAHTLSYTSYLDSLLENKELREVYLKGLREFDSLEGEQHLLLTAFWGKVFRFHESAYYQWRAGRFDEDTWATFNGFASEVVGYPGVQSWWRSRSQWFSRNFRGHIDSLIDKAEARPLYPTDAGE